MQKPPSRFLGIDMDLRRRCRDAQRRFNFQKSRIAKEGTDGIDYPGPSFQIGSNGGLSGKCMASRRYEAG
jgi:hypothetical protein